jgi:hypothetical protein
VIAVKLNNLGLSESECISMLPQRIEQIRDRHAASEESRPTVKKAAAPAAKVATRAKKAAPPKKAAAPAKKAAAPAKAAPQVTITLKQIAAQLAEGPEEAGRSGAERLGDAHD